MESPQVQTLIRRRKNRINQKDKTILGGVEFELATFWTAGKSVNLMTTVFFYQRSIDGCI